MDSMSSFLSEGVGFRALSRNDENIHASTPVYRFYNPNLGSHFFTAFEEEKDHVLELENFIFEGIDSVRLIQIVHLQFQSIGFSMQKQEGIFLLLVS